MLYNNADFIRYMTVRYMMKSKMRKFDLFRLWLLLTALLLVTILVSETFAKKSSNDVKSADSDKTEKKAEVEYRSR